MDLDDENVAVVVVAFNSEGVLPGLVSSLAVGFGEVPWYLYVADNASLDGSVALVRDFVPTATVVELSSNGGYASGINAAVGAANSYTAILVLNPDVRLTAGCVPELLRALREPGAGIAVPRLLDAEGERIDSMRREPTVLRAFGDAFLGARRAGRYPLLGEMVTDPRRYENETVTDWAEGSTQLISAECWAQCGPWDESFFLYSEETDFDLRAGDAGFATRYVPTAQAIHLEGDSGSSPQLWALLVLNRVRFFRRRNGIVRAVPFWAATLLRELTRAVLGKRTSRAAVRALVSPRRFREVPGPHTVSGG